MENRHITYINFENLEFTLTMYHAHMEQQSTITATEQTVINRELPKQLQNFVVFKPLV
jgi:hypothetical protein